jgi:PTS system fructose-specific IIC component
MAAVMAAGMAVPLGLAAATRLRQRLFTPAERRHAATATALGALFVTEGAIPYAVRDPLRVLPAGVLGGASAGATTMALHVTLDAPHGGVLALFAVGHVGVFLAALALGAGVTAVAVTCAKQTLMKPTGRLQPQWAGGAE